MKAFGIAVVATLLVAGLLPFVLIAKSRSSQKDALPIHLVMDMDKQNKFKAQRPAEMFADGRSMRPQIAGTIAQEDLWLNSPTLNDIGGTHPVGLAGGNTSAMISDPAMFAAVTLGRIRGADVADEAFGNATPPNKNDIEINGDKTYYVAKVPAAFAVTPAFLKRGQERFNIYCAPCHGESGYGDGNVNAHATALQHTADAINGWAPPQNLNEDKIIHRPDGHLFNTISEGRRNMPAYDKQISIEDRWAIVAYVRALQLSQNAPASAGTPSAAASQNQIPN
ncbi:MAG TPA: cytochrome c [Phycisphaerae bacterium]|jgi:mono/diheme cytochrome c family protein|nr:cytochrome c [Phycisphaerae bacterium]